MNSPAESIVAVILAAGKSTRMNSTTPKVLHPIFGRRMIEYVLDAVRAAGASRILVVIGHEGEQVKSALANEPGIEFVWQHNPQGTGHAVMMCAEQLATHPGRVMVLAGDTPLLRGHSLKSLLHEQQTHSAAAVIGSARTDSNFGLGRIVRDAAGAFLRIVEQKDATPEEHQITEINTGCYVFQTPELLSSLGEIRANNSQGELYLTDCPAILLGQGKTVRAIDALTIEEAMGVNTRQQLADVRRVMHWTNLQKLMQSGVGILSPEHVDIDPRAEIGKETLIHPFSVIEGPAKIGANCTIGPNAVISGAIVPDGVVVKPFEHRR